MPALDAGIFFGGMQEDDRIESGHDERFRVYIPVFVIPAKVRTQFSMLRKIIFVYDLAAAWVPAFAGMTELGFDGEFNQRFDAIDSLLSST